MLKILKVAQREYVETTKTKTFIIGVLMAPIIIGGIIFFTQRIGKDRAGPRPPVMVAAADLTGELSNNITAAFERYNKSNPNRQIQIKQLEVGEGNADELSERQKEKVRRGRLQAYLVLDANAVAGSGKLHIYTHKTKASEMDAIWAVENLINQAIIERRCELKEVSRDLLDELRRRVPSEHVTLGTDEDSERVQKHENRIVGMMTPFFFMYLMFFGIFVNGQQMLTSLIEEKSSRVIEVLLSAVSPFELMAGKISGLAGVGLTVIGIWSVGAYGAAVWQGWDIDIGAEIVVYFVVYYILGFLFFSSIQAGIGSICNTLKEAQSLMMPVTLVFVLPLIGWFNLVQHPNGTLARVLTFVPPLTSMVAVLRLSASSDIRVAEVIGSMAVLAVSVAGVMWLSAKVFRTGILMYGKRPRLREVIRWLRQS